jgi:hypothetical protein
MVKQIEKYWGQTRINRPTNHSIGPRA